MIPIVGAGITVAVKLHLHDAPVLRRAYVTEIGNEIYAARAPQGKWIVWKSGSKTGEVFENQEGVEWIHGHGPKARAALLAARAL